MTSWRKRWIGRGIFTDTLRQAISHDIYILDGRERTFLPHFTFHGFRYICVEGMKKEDIDLKDFTACAMHTDMEQTGNFCCSHPAGKPACKQHPVGAVG